MLLTAVGTWATVGVIRYYIPLDAVPLITLRSLLGIVFLVGALLVLRSRFDWDGLKRNARWLLASGVVFCLSWVLLFEAFKHTTVAVAVLCYYMAPIFVMLCAPVFLHESLNIRKVIGIVAAFIGIGCVSGLGQGSSAGVTTEGLLCGLGSAVFYAAVVLFNKRMTPMDATSKTLVQLVITAMILVPYSSTLSWPSMDVFTSTVIGLIVMLGFVHTGLACALYFAAIERLPAQTVALYSYFDPILAVLLSAFVLQEPMSTGTIIGTVLVLGGAFIGETRPRRTKAV